MMKGHVLTVVSDFSHNVVLECLAQIASFFFFYNFFFLRVIDSVKNTYICLCNCYEFY